MEYMDRNMRKLMDSRLDKGNFGADAFELHEEELTTSKIALGMACCIPGGSCIGT